MSVHYTVLPRATVVDSAGGLRRGGTFVAADSNLVLYTRIVHSCILCLFFFPSHILAPGTGFAAAPDDADDDDDDDDDENYQHGWFALLDSARLARQNIRCIDLCAPGCQCLIRAHGDGTKQRRFLQIE